MGTAIGIRLLGVGHDLCVWNRTPAKTKALAERGASVAATPAEVARQCEAVITVLTDAAAVEAVYRGRDGLLSAEATGKLFIEMSTVRSETPRALGPAVAAKGAALVECPVGGTVGPAREGKLLGFAGGADPDVARARPILEQLCRRLEHVGPLGAGAKMKLAINLPLMVYWQALSEGLTLARPLGLDPERLISIFADSSGGPNVLKVRGGTIAAALKGNPPAEISFDVNLIRKDLRTMLDEARGEGRALPVAAKTLQVLDAAAREGLGSKDCSALMPHWVEHGKDPGA